MSLSKGSKSSTDTFPATPGLDNGRNNSSKSRIRRSFLRSWPSSVVIPSRNVSARMHNVHNVHNVHRVLVANRVYVSPESGYSGRSSPHLANVAEV